MRREDYFLTINVLQPLFPTLGRCIPFTDKSLECIPFVECPFVGCPAVGIHPLKGICIQCIPAVYTWQSAGCCAVDRTDGIHNINIGRWVVLYTGHETDFRFTAKVLRLKGIQQMADGIHGGEPPLQGESIWG